MNAWIFAQSDRLQGPAEQLLSRISSNDLIPITFIVTGMLAGLIVALSVQWRLHRRTEMELGLKQEMLARGMSAEDIERVIKAGASSSHCEK